MPKTRFFSSRSNPRLTALHNQDPFWLPASIYFGPLTMMLGSLMMTGNWIDVVVSLFGATMTTGSMMYLWKNPRY